MPTSTRAAGRDIHIFDAAGDRTKSIGGLILTAGVTNANFYAMIEIFVIFNGEYVLRNESDLAIKKDNSPLQSGNYYIDSTYPILLTNATPVTRTISLQTGTRVRDFRDAVRLRDRACVVTGRKAIDADRGNWAGLETAHIFPLAYQEAWNAQNFDRWINSLPSGDTTPGSKINSVQNGLLLRNDIHQLFDMFFISINPDDNYKVVCFDVDVDGIAGRYFAQRPPDDIQRVPESLLRWHFNQAVLSNMKGAGEPIFEHDFPPGSDMVGTIREGPKAAQRMEFELFNRLATSIHAVQEGDHEP